MITNEILEADGMAFRTTTAHLFPFQTLWPAYVLLALLVFFILVVATMRRIRRKSLGDCGRYVVILCAMGGVLMVGEILIGVRAILWLMVMESAPRMKILLYTSQFCAGLSVLAVFVGLSLLWHRLLQVGTKEDGFPNKASQTTPLRSESER